MSGPKAKEMASGGRYGLSGIGPDVMRVFNRALELVSSNAQDSDKELLDMVKRAKRETEKEPFNLPKKARTGRVPETTELQALGHRTAVGSSGDHGPVQQTTTGPDGGSVTAAGAAGSTGSANMTQAQTRLMNVIRGPGRGRIEKPKRKGSGPPVFCCSLLNRKKAANLSNTIRNAAEQIEYQMSNTMRCISTAPSLVQLRYLEDRKSSFTF
ncbi:hypothetical protein R1flu_017042 [Riccia fluitans]|uniref:Uncharacterized protein n=1 Tax=Riccia fluitans TaxID=41844 RepID=A0ABD1YNK6_9MARC